MNILSLNVVTDDSFSCFVETDKTYSLYQCFSSGRVLTQKSYEKDKFSSFKMFKAKMGKFNPYIKFLKEKKVVSEVNFDECTKIQKELKND